MSGFFASQSVSVGSTISGAVAEDIFFGGAGGTLAQDDEVAVKTVAGSKNVRMGGAITFDARLTLKGDDNTGNIMQWYFGTKGVLMSCNGLSVTNLGGIAFHINISGDTTGIDFNEDATLGNEGHHLLFLNGIIATRTVPLLKIRRGATPAAGADYIAFLDTDAVTKLSKISRTGSFCFAEAADLGGVNVKASGAGYFIVVNDTTHYANNKLNFAGDYALEIDAVNAKGRLSERQGPDIAAANNLVLGTGAFTAGNFYVVTGNTQINLLDKTSWQDGSLVTLHFTGTPTVKSDQATSGNNTQILLTGGLDLVVAAPTNLSLRLSTIGGVQAWRQEGPSLPIA